ncbi:MAG: DUF1049 domain-containing protein [Erythrobacter sp.]|nr:DUF1049 domain-containing protein [Erythrobacter sp.]
MKILRTIIWILAALGFLIFAIYNWRPVELTLWQNLVLETKVPALALLAFAAGFVPLWAYHLSVKWALNRRVRALENSLKNMALARQAETAVSNAAPIVDSPVDKAGTKTGEPADPFNPSNPGSAGDGK